MIAASPENRPVVDVEKFWYRWQVGKGGRWGDQPNLWRKRTVPSQGGCGMNGRILDAGIQRSYGKGLGFGILDSEDVAGSEWIRGVNNELTSLDLVTCCWFGRRR